MLRPDADIDEGLDPEGPSAEDLDRFGDEFTACPNCGSLIYDQAEICPRCGEAIIRQAHRPPIWVWIALILALAACLWLVI